MVHVKKYVYVLEKKGIKTSELLLSIKNSNRNRAFDLLLLSICNSRLAQTATKNVNTFFLVHPHEM